MKPASTSQESVQNAKIIPFPTKSDEVKKELTYSETYNALWDAIEMMDTFYDRGKHYRPSAICLAVLNEHEAQKYGEVMP